MTIGDICEFKLKFENADFWLIRKGSEDMVGKPVNEYSPEHIGVKIINTDVIDKKYLYYVFMFLHQNGSFKRISNGILNLKHIKISDIKEIPVSVK